MVCTALPHQRAACLSSGEQPSSVFHIAVKEQTNIDASLKSSPLSPPRSHLFFSLTGFTGSCVCVCVSPVEGSGSCPCLSLWIFHCEPLCSVLPMKNRTRLSVPTVCSYIPGVFCTSHTRKRGVIWKPHMWAHRQICFHVADMGLSMDYV